MREYNPGDRVWWDDPDDGICSAAYTVEERLYDDVYRLKGKTKDAVLEAPSSELTPLNKYRVHGYVVVRVPLEVEGKDHEHAIEQYEEDFFKIAKDAEFADEIDGFLVDEDGDEEYRNSGFYGSDGKTPALSWLLSQPVGDRCSSCLRHHKTGEKPDGS